MMKRRKSMNSKHTPRKSTPLKKSFTPRQLDSDQSDESDNICVIEDIHVVHQEDTEAAEIEIDYVDLNEMKTDEYTDSIQIESNDDNDNTIKETNSGTDAFRVSSMEYIANRGTSIIVQ